MVQKLINYSRAKWLWFNNTSIIILLYAPWHPSFSPETEFVIGKYSGSTWLSPPSICNNDYQPCHQDQVGGEQWFFFSSEKSHCSSLTLFVTYSSFDSACLQMRLGASYIIKTILSLFQYKININLINDDSYCDGDLTVILSQSIA